MQLQKSNFLQGGALKVATRSKLTNSLSPKLTSSDQSNSTRHCKIYEQKIHKMINCFSCLNVTRYPPMHEHEIFSLGSSSLFNSTNLSSPTSANCVTSSLGHVMSMWHLDSGATSHITNDGANIQHSRFANSNHKIYTVEM